MQCHAPGGADHDLKILMNGIRIRPSSYIKYLGVFLDATLSANHHCNLLVKNNKKSKWYVNTDQFRAFCVTNGLKV